MFLRVFSIDSQQVLTLSSTLALLSLKNVMCCWDARSETELQIFLLMFKYDHHAVTSLSLAESTHSHVPSFSPQIGNVRPETEITWYKDKIEIADDDEDAQKIERQEGELTFNIGKVSPLYTGRCLWGVVGSWVQSKQWCCWCSYASISVVD